MKDSASTPIEDKINFIKDLEQEALALDPRIVAVNYCMYNEIEKERYINNTKGLTLKDSSNLAYAYLMVVAKEGEETKTGFSYLISNSFTRF